MVPREVGCKQRHVRYVAHAVGGIAEKAALPGRLWPALAGAADNAVNRRRSGRAGARSATSSGIAQIGVAKLVAGAVGSVCFVGAEEPYRGEFAGAGVVPRDFRNIGEGRAIRRAVGRTPISPTRLEVCVAEIGAAGGDRIGRGGLGVDADAVDRRVRRTSSVAIAGRSILVAAGDEV